VRPAARVLAAAAIALTVFVAGQDRADAAPKGFFGVVPSAVPSPTEFDRMRQGGVGSLRFLIYWPDVQPVGPTSYDWSDVDAIVAGSAAAGIPMLPFFYGTPGWAADCTGIPEGFCDRADPLRTPAGRAGWPALLAATVDRYGPNGTFWTDPTDAFAPPTLPIRDWQIWNESNSTTFWRPTPSAKRYAALVKLSRGVIRGRDRGARIHLAGLFGTPPKPSPSLWTFLDRLYRVKGMKAAFDTVAVHPYSPGTKGIIYQLRRAREVMEKHRDGKTKLMLTEIGWGSGSPGGSAGEGRLQKGASGQATLLRSSFKQLAEQRKTYKIGRVYWFTWRDTPGGACYLCETAGLFSLSGEAKPSWTAFARAAGGRP
jgi:hypothetical protein